MVGIIVVLGPHGHPPGGVAYLGHHTNRHHLYPNGWKGRHEWYSRLLLAQVCLLCYTSGVAELAPRGGRARGMAVSAKTVMAMAAPLLVSMGCSLTRTAEISEPESTGWALWMIVPFVYIGLG